VTKIWDRNTIIMEDIIHIVIHIIEVGIHTAMVTQNMDINLIMTNFV